MSPFPVICSVCCMIVTSRHFLHDFTTIKDTHAAITCELYSPWRNCFFSSPVLVFIYARYMVRINASSTKKTDVEKNTLDNSPRMHTSLYNYNCIHGNYYTWVETSKRHLKRNFVVYVHRVLPRSPLVAIRY